MNDAMLFNPDEFLSSNVDGALSTRLDPTPEGEYKATIKDVAKPRLIQPKDPTKAPFAVIDIVWLLDAPDLAAKLGRKELTVRQGVMLDIAGGKLDTAKGKNITLGRLREAVKQNGPGSWSPTQLVGAGPAVVMVTHRPDKDNSDIVYDEIRKVAALS